MLIALTKYDPIRNYFYRKSFWLMSQKCYIKKTVDQKGSTIKPMEDVIGPADPLSNLRIVIFAKSQNETNLEKRYRKAREDTQQWNQIFWAKHNTNFAEERKKYQQVLKAKGKMVTADDMSVFYKKFLDKNWQTHFDYNISWYKRNIKLLFYELMVRISKLKLM